MEAETILKVRNLRVSYSGRGTNLANLVKGIDFDVPRGGCLGILGESGSGKSLSCKAILGILGRGFSIGGSAIFGDLDLLSCGRETLRRLRGSRIGMIMQNPMTSFDPLYRIGDQIRETLRAHADFTESELRWREIEMLERMMLRNPQEILRKYPHQLSGGMLQRVMIALALALDPDLLIADEPTTALDAVTQSEIIQEILRIKNERQLSVIFISHDLGVISRVADSVVVMNRGAVVDRGSFAEIITQATDSYTRLLVETRKELLSRFRERLNDNRSLATC